MDDYQGDWQQGTTGQYGYQQPVEPHVPPGGYYSGPPQHGQRRVKKSGRGGTVVTAIAAAIIGALIVLIGMPAIFGVNPYDLVRGKLKDRVIPIAQPVSNTKSPTSAQSSSDVTTIAKNVTPSIVNIDVRSTARSTNPFFPSSQEQQGTGSGVIYSADGYIITNNHVVEGATDIAVTLASGTEVKARTIGTDPENDIAVIKIEKSGLPAITVGNSDSLQVGQLVVAVGSPLGFEQTVTAGIISALHRTLGAQNETGSTTVLTDLIQTDAPINPGNSGGALCDAGSKLIAINTMIASQSGGSEGLGFAIPINNAKRVADDIIAGRPVSHPYIGIQGQSVSESVASQYKLPVTHGAYITALVPGGPCEKAGLKVGDIIVSINGQPVKTMDDLISAVRKAGVGGKATVEYYEGTSKKKADVTVAEEPANLNLK